MSREIDRIGFKLASLRALWKRLGGPPPAFAGRSVVSEPPIAIELVEAFEKRVGARLPDDYREFVTRISSGGLGPGRGLVALDDPAQWRALGGNRPPRELRMFGYAEHNWGGWVFTALTGPRRGTLWIDTEEGVRPLSASGEPTHPRAEPVGFAAWYERWLDSVIETDKVFASQRDDVERLLEVVACAMRPKRVEISKTFADESDVDECWERLVTNELAMPESDRREFVERCPVLAERGAKNHDATCVVCAGAGRVVRSRPSTIAGCVAIASMSRAMLEAERLAREFAVRLADWGPSPSPDAAVRWSQWQEPEPVRDSGSTAVVAPAKRELERALALTIRADSRSKSWQRDLTAIAARVAGREPSLAVRSALAAEVSLMLVERAQRERGDASLEALARYSPFEPLTHIWRSGFALVSVDANSIELAAVY